MPPLSIAMPRTRRATRHRSAWGLSVRCMSVWCMAAWCLTGLLLSACTSAPPSASSPHTALPRSAFEQQQLALARAQAAQGHLAEAATHWDILSVLRPDEPSYAQQLAQLRAQIERQAAKELGEAKAARQRGAIDEASQHYLAVLALRPDDEAAADGLRAIEREHNKREHLGRYARLTLGSSAYKESLQKGDLGANALSAQRNDLEHAALLAGQGEFDDAITLLTQRLKARPQDAATKELLADVYLAQAEAIAPRDKDKAIAALKQCLQLQPRYAAARARLAQLTAKP